MGSLISFLIHPFSTIRQLRDPYDEDGGLDDFIYRLTIFFAFGIYTVIRRHLNAQSRAKPFYIETPEEANPAWSSAQSITGEYGIESHKYIESLAPPIGELSGRDYITCYDPATGLHLDTLLSDNTVEIEEKINKAQAAQVKWKTSSFAHRKRVIRSLKKWLVENQEDCARVACRDTGKTLIDAALGEILTTCSKMDWLLRHGEKYLSPETRSSTLLLFYKTSQVHYEPLGVVAAIVSWNYPLHNAWSPILAALFAGNAIVLKCSEQVFWSTRWFVDVIKECLRACNFDPELVQVCRLVCCYPDQVEALTRSPKIKHITFIGSRDVGRQVAVAAAQHLTPVTLELGGKDPAIVLPGTDVQKWASLWMRGIFQNAGQNCIGIERLLVHRSQYDEVYDLIVSRAQTLRAGASLAGEGVGLGSTIDMGSMISRSRFTFLNDKIADAQAHGAQVGHGGKVYTHPYLNHGAFFEPTVIGEVKRDMSIARTELFAPVALLMPYDTIEEAIEIANDTEYALGASVFGPDKYECLDVAKRLECGMVSINDFGVFYVIHPLTFSLLSQDLPFGGVKGSGYGRLGGPEGLRSLTNAKAVVFDRFPWLVQTSIPWPLDYPIRSSTQAWAAASGIVGAVHADGWRESFESIQRVINAVRRRP
ncbi:meiotic sister-chromatid recombination aldehyde dehydrogenase [Gloeopeniophorella convolvens]|nr:meiotic sister-chromatid recombination aldehyde dehydrogenase [Gloeopeniophorella convolvens]